VRVIPVRGGGRGVLVHLVEDELARVLLVLHHIEAKAARLSAGSNGILSHDFEELVEPLRLHLDLDQDGHHLRDGAGTIQARRHSSTATAATSGHECWVRSRGRREGTSLRKRLSCESGPARLVSGAVIELDATKAEVRGSEMARSSSIIASCKRIATKGTRNKRVSVRLRYQRSLALHCLGEAATAT
jgi:hypothetical protein